MSESGRSVIVDVQDVEMVYNAKNRDESRMFMRCAV